MLINKDDKGTYIIFVLIVNLLLIIFIIKGGPVQKITIPKDREGKQRTYGFITYKHMKSVEYALLLFDGTMLYNRTLNMKPRNNTESQQAEQFSNPVRNMNYMLELGQQMMLGNYSPQTGSGDGGGAIFGINILQDGPIYPRQLDTNSGNDTRIRSHPYQRNRDRNQDRDRDRNQERGRNRERNRDREREKEKGRSKERNHSDHRDERSYYNRDNGYRFNDYFRYNDNRKRWTYH
ncbi:negative elongation factor E isoform X2 [Solenopsis invicta]|uniref:negative elongation factor E isoform X2 n=1 Tax=Solenopsis invicta TaxID=13686 RepID=UPI00193E4E95|nr:negative elongation factor E isoform X2 [Solenopsis invicta]XP_039304068.1 negative elongation factor E isoform X2 [Solenopsis invicta]